MKKKNESSITMLCRRCGKVTPHYLNKKGDYVCLVCGAVGKSIKMKEIKFEMAPELDTLLNGKEEPATELGE